MRIVVEREIWRRKRGKENGEYSCVAEAMEGRRKMRVGRRDFFTQMT